MLQADFILPAILGGGLACGWIFARWLVARYDREHKAGSDGIFDQMEMTYAPRRSLEIHTRLDDLPRVLGRVMQEVDSGFGKRQAKLLVKRINGRGPLAARAASFPIRVNRVSSDLEIQWSRESGDQVRLLVLAGPKIIRALKRHQRAERHAAIAGPAAAVGAGDAARPAGIRAGVVSPPLLGPAAGASRANPRRGRLAAAPSSLKPRLTIESSSAGTLSKHSSSLSMSPDSQLPAPEAANPTPYPAREPNEVAPRRLRREPTPFPAIPSSS